MYDEPNRSIFKIRFPFDFDIYSKISNILQIKKRYFLSHVFTINLQYQPLLPRICTMPVMKGPFYGPSSGKKILFPCTRGSDSENLENSFIKGMQCQCLAGIKLSAL